MSKANLYKDGVKAFWHFVDKRGPSECWEWKGSKVAPGYGRIKLKGKASRAHRLSYEINIGPIPDGMLIRHMCHNKSCVNPAHLEPGTEQDNKDDDIARGMVFRGDEHWTRAAPSRVLKGERHGMAKLDNEKVAAIRQSYAAGAKRRRLAAEHGVCWSTINRIVKGEGWK